MSRRNKRRQRRIIWILLAALVVIVAGGYSYYTYVYLPSTVAVTTDEATVQTAVARRGDLVIYASGTGEIIPASDIAIGFEESGTLLEVLVAVGEEVHAGDVLARLQTKNTPESIALDIANAQLEVIKNQQALDAIYENAELEAALALQALDTAQSDLDNILDPDVELELAQAQVSLLAAQEKLDEAIAARQNLNYQRCLDSTIESYEAQYYLALDRYERQEEYYNEHYASLPDTDPDRLNALAALLNAEESVQKALANLNWCLGEATEAEIAEADANIVLAEGEVSEIEARIEELEAGPDPVDVTLAEARLAQAQREWEAIKDGPDADEIALAEAQLAYTEAKLALALETQAVIELSAPMDGTVLSISASVGESVGTNAIITLANLRQPMLQVYLDETDFYKVGVGFEVEVVFDAFPDEIFGGQVVQIDPSLVSTQGASVVSVVVQLDPASFSKPLSMPIGMGAAVDVIGGRALDAVLVPVEALRDLGAGEYAVFVMTNDEPLLRVVEVGLMDFTYAEIVSGLQPGEVVTTGIVETE